MKKINKKQQDKINQGWLHKNGAGDFDFKERTINLYGLFALEIEKKRVPRTRIWVDKKHPIISGTQKFYELKSTKLGGTKIQEDCRATIWFEELHETITYLQRMEKLLKKLGYNTNGIFKQTKLKEVKK